MIDNVINFDFRKLEQFTLCSCSFCHTQYKMFKQPDARTPIIYMAKDGTSRICSHCIRILNAQLKGVKE